MPRLTARAQQGVVEAWAEFTRDPSFYGLAGKLFIDAADHAMKAGLNSYAALFLNEAINAKKVADIMPRYPSLVCVHVESTERK